MGEAEIDDKLLCLVQRKTKKLEIILHLHLIITCLQVSALLQVFIFQEEMYKFCTDSLPNPDTAPVALQKLPFHQAPSQLWLCWCCFQPNTSIEQKIR